MKPCTLLDSLIILTFSAFSTCSTSIRTPKSHTLLFCPRTIMSNRNRKGRNHLCVELWILIIISMTTSKTNICNILARFRHNCRRKWSKLVWFQLFFFLNKSLLQCKNKKRTHTGGKEKDYPANSKMCNLGT